MLKSQQTTCIFILYCVSLSKFFVHPFGYGLKAAQMSGKVGNFPPLVYVTDAAKPCQGSKTNT